MISHRTLNEISKTGSYNETVNTIKLAVIESYIIPNVQIKFMRAPIMWRYSEKYIMIKYALEYSVLYPATNSDSASSKSNGARWLAEKTSTSKEYIVRITEERHRMTFSDNNSWLSKSEIIAKTAV